jgi:hypothetical protein
MDKGTAFLIVILSILLISALVMICWLQLSWRKFTARKRYKIFTFLAAIAIGLQLALFAISAVNGNLSIAGLSLVTSMLFVFAFFLERRKLRREF